VTALHSLSLLSVLIFTSHWHFGLSSGLLAAGCSTKILWAYAILISPLSLFRICCPLKCRMPVTEVARSEAWTVFARSNAGIVGSNPTQGMDICIMCVYSVFVLSCVQVEALRRADPPSKESYRLSIRLRNWSETKRFTDAPCSRGSNRNVNERTKVYQGKGFRLRPYEARRLCVGTDVSEEPSFSDLWIEVAEPPKLQYLSIRLHAVCLLTWLVFKPEDGGCTFLRNLWQATSDHTRRHIHGSIWNLTYLSRDTGNWMFTAFSNVL
jgi:hypothetical protein